MTERAKKDKLKRTLSLSKTKRGSIKDGASASSTPTTTPITSFFSSRPPPKLACPLCGQLVPRFKINEHIDLQCQNFERNVSASASDDATSNQDAPRSPKKDEDGVKEQTSPYFKKSHFKKTSPETNKKCVVRVLDLGSLSAKLSRKRQKIPETTQKADKHAPEHHGKEMSSESLDSSQKENLLQRFEGTEDCVTVVDLATTSAPGIQSGSETGCFLDHNASGLQEQPAAPNQSWSSSTFVKRKTMFSSGTIGSRKKTKYDTACSRKMQEASCPESATDAAGQKQPNANELSTIATDSLPECSVSDVDAEKFSKDARQASGVESSPADQDVRISQPSRLPYYLQNFRAVLGTVLENEDDRALFDQHDTSHIQAFEKLSGILTRHSVMVYLGMSK